jgi:hypothetical protein
MAFNSQQERCHHCALQRWGGCSVSGDKAINQRIRIFTLFWGEGGWEFFTRMPKTLRSFRRKDVSFPNSCTNTWSGYLRGRYVNRLHILQFLSTIAVVNISEASLCATWLTAVVLTAANIQSVTLLLEQKWHMTLTSSNECSCTIHMWHEKKIFWLGYQDIKVKTRKTVTQHSTSDHRWQWGCQP